MSFMLPRTRLLPRAAAFLVALCAPLVSPWAGTTASASVSIAVTWDGLLHESSEAVVVTSAESLPVWENGRIYTYTHVHVDRPVAGSLSTGGEAWVRTMGGVVGKVGQLVEGEASFATGETSLVFLRPGPVGAFVVTARGQGQFPVVSDTPGAAPHLVKSNAVGMLLAPRSAGSNVTPRLASDVLHGRIIDDVARDILAAWGAAHAQ